jgi:beta-glucanase (GH16 family)
MNMKYLYLLPILLLAGLTAHAQSSTIADDFEGNGTIPSWVEDNCALDANKANPFPQGINPSNTVLEYHDTGGQYANIRFQLPNHFELYTHHTFSLKVYVPSSGLTGNQANQISLKLQNGDIDMPWSTQSEVIKSITLDEWQTVTFNFQSDNYINLDPSSPSPTRRRDFNRVLLQVNGENNNDHVLAYIDDFSYDGVVYADRFFEVLAWSDEFEVDGALNSEKWFHQTELPNGNSWFNGEIQHYTDRLDNTYVEDGILYLTAKKENFTDQGVTKQYTSARLNSKYAFTYGKVEIRAKLPTGVGTWPAIWMLGKNISENGAYWQTQGYGTTPWPDCGEIDIMEHWGNNQNYVQSATHTPSSYGATVNHDGIYRETASTEFHVYALEWMEDRLIFSVDEIVLFVYNPPIKNASTWPFDAEQYLLLNIAIQAFIDPSFTSDAMEIDYVRIYEEGVLSSLDFSAIQEENINAFPNPFRSELRLELKQFSDQNAILQMYTLDGKLIQTRSTAISNHQLVINGLDHLTSGTYLFRVLVDGEAFLIKGVKE